MEGHHPHPSSAGRVWGEGGRVECDEWRVSDEGRDDCICLVCLLRSWSSGRLGGGREGWGEGYQLCGQE